MGIVILSKTRLNLFFASSTICSALDFSMSSTPLAGCVAVGMVSGTCLLCITNTKGCLRICQTEQVYDAGGNFLEQSSRWMRDSLCLFFLEMAVLYTILEAG